MADQIIFNGKSYNGVEEMPEKERMAYEAVINAFADKNANGIPDILEGAAGGIETGSARVVVNSRVVTDLDQLSPEDQEKYRQAMQKLDADGNGIPDFVEGMLGMHAPAADKSSLVTSEPVFQTSEPVFGAAPNVEPEGVNKHFLILAFLLLVVLCLGAGIMVVLLTR